MTPPLVEPDARTLVVDDAPAQRCAAAVAEAIEATIAARGRCRIALSGGSTPGPMLDALVELLPRAVHRQITVTWVDERWVPLDDPQSNFALARRWLDHAPSIATLPLYRGESPTADAAALCAAFDAELGGLDIAVLGAGPDGHIASLFPGHPALDAAGPVIAITDSPKPPPVRLTLSRAVLDATPHLMLLARGANKAPVLARAWVGDPAIPLGRLRPSGRFTWFCDAAAAAHIDHARTHGESPR